MLPSRLHPRHIIAFPLIYLFMSSFFAEAQTDLESCVTVDGKSVACPESQSLDSLMEEYQNILANFNPLDSSNQDNTDAMRRLPDVSLATKQKRSARLEAFSEKVKALDTTILSDEERLNYTLLNFSLAQHLRLDPFDEGRIPFTSDSGFFNTMIYTARQTKFQKAEDYEAYASRLSALPRYFGQNKENMRRGIETNFVAYNGTMPGIINVVKEFAQIPIEQHPLYEPFKKFPSTIGTAEQNRLRALGQAAMKNAVVPAYEDLLDFLKKEYQPKARTIPGIGTTPEGRAYYASLVRYYTSLDMTPDEVHELGLKEVRRIRGEMDKIIKDLKFEGDFKAFVKFLRTDPQFYATSAEELLKEAAWIAKTIDGKMPEFFGKLPRLSYGILPVPDSIAPTYTTGRYWVGNPAQGKSGNYMVNTYDLSQRPLYNLPALTLHEGVPGHHHQISLAQELKNRPTFIRNMYVNAFGEGWGLYSEKLGVEMGIYKNAYEDFGRLTYEMWRACRLVVDTGLHWKGWSKEQAEACFYDNSALSSHNIKTEVERYISWPGQALSYKIGEIKILELRREAEAQLGENFSIRDFHDAVLAHGSVPLSVLDTIVHDWIEAQITH